MRVLVIAAGLFLALPGVVALAVNHDDDEERLVKCGDREVVIFPNSTSDDGRYAIGWSIRPTMKGASAVDWSRWRDGDHDLEFLKRYPWNDGERENPPYSLDDYAVDLKMGTSVLLPDPWEADAHLNTAWFRDGNVNENAFVSKDHHFGTREFRIVMAGKSGMHPVNVLGMMESALEKYLRKVRPVDYEEYFDTYFTGESVSDGHAVVSFEAENLKTPGYPIISGTLRLRLPDGEIEATSGDAETDDPFQSDAELAKADRELNAAYSTLRQGLSIDAREKLRKEQAEWITRRNREAAPESDYGDNQSQADFIKARNGALLQATEKRTGELRKRIEKGR